MLSRREFSKACSLLALAPSVPLFLERSANAAPPEADERVLVVVQLDGGNDSLNTLVPFRDEAYSKARPTLKVSPDDVLKLSDDVGLNPALKPLGSLVEASNLAVVAGVGYPNPSRSHFRSMAVWQSARLDPEEHNSYGWLGRALDSGSAGSLLTGEGNIPLALRGRRSRAAALSKLSDYTPSDPKALTLASIIPVGESPLAGFVQRQLVDADVLARQLGSSKLAESGVSYPYSPFATNLKTIAQLLKTKNRTRVFYTIQSGYDTHTSQGTRHRQLLDQFSEGGAAFFEDLREAKLAERVVLLAFSEFGRTLVENGSAGTDHGTAGTVFAIGSAVKGGVHGLLPSLTKLERGEPKPTTDFRRVYSGLLRDWLGIDPKEALGGDFEPLKLLG